MSILIKRKRRLIIGSDEMSQDLVEDFLKKEGGNTFTADEIVRITHLSVSTVHANLRRLRNRLVCRNCRYPLRGIEKTCPECKKQQEFEEGIKWDYDIFLRSNVYWWGR